MKTAKGIRLYVAAIWVLAAALLYTTNWSPLTHLGQDGYVGLGALVVIGLLAEQQALTIRVGRLAGGYSVTFLPLMVVVLLFGPAAALGFMLCVAPISQYLFQRKEPLRASFNMGQYVASTALAGLAYGAVGGIALVGPHVTSVIHQLLPFLLFGIVLVIFNNAAVTLAISLTQDLSFAEVWATLVGQTGINIVADLLIGPIAVAVAALYLQMGPMGWVGLCIAILPLLFVRHSYLTNQQLQTANQDLLKALVKAIETRDPYTSGHSLRVARLAKDIAHTMGVSGRRAEAIENAALLHDIGKIEGVYSEILKKPETLSKEERAVIESHVTKGAELLGSLTSFDEPVILAVKHHHEHFDGSGYPDGLKGSEIPLGARIIKVCDAIDAMLSDRPYRRALTIPQVYEQMELYSGIQFDPEIVDCVLTHDMIRLHRTEHSEQRTQPEPEPSAPAAVPIPSRLVANA